MNHACSRQVDDVCGGEMSPGLNFVALLDSRMLCDAGGGGRGELQQDLRWRLGA